MPPRPPLRCVLGVDFGSGFAFGLGSFFLREQVNVGTWLRSDKVNPTLEEIQRFKSRREKKEPG